MCPTYRAWQRADGPISEEAYLQIWLAPGSESVNEVYTPDPPVCTS
jgi:hypothetical protein